MPRDSAFHRVHRAAQQYPQLEAELQASLNVIPAYTWYALPSGALTFANERTGDYLGLTKDHPFRLGIDTAAEWDAKALLRAVDAGESFSVMHRWRRADGEYRWHHTMGEPFTELAAQPLT